MMKTCFLSVVTILGLCVAPALRSHSAASPSSPETADLQETQEAFPVSIRVDVQATKGELRPIWRFFGYDEPNFTYMTNGQKLLTELSELSSEPVYIRTHHLLTSGDGTPALKWGSTGAYIEDANGAPIYNWTIVDRIFDTLREKKLRPLVEVGFMPEALSIHPQDYPHHPPSNKMVSPGLGFSYPPKDYRKWGELCQAWAQHCVQRYGAEEVEHWRWEIWNEPNIFYWKATPEEYYRLYDFATEGIRRALPKAMVGGPHTAGGPGGSFLHNFLVHCLYGTNYATGRIGSPLDFVAFHAKGNPKFENGHVRMGIANQLQNIDQGFGAITDFPELKNVPVIIGECDPEGCAACQGPQLGYRNGTMYPSYTAASFSAARALAEKHGINFQGALTWAFEFEDQPYFAGFRALASNGIDLPVLNVFRMFGKMLGDRLQASSSADSGIEGMLREGVRGQPQVGVLAARDQQKLSVLVWHYHDDDVLGPDAAIDLLIKGLPRRDGPVNLQHYRIDALHSNSFELWKKLGSPQQPTAEQYEQLEKAGKLALLDEPTIQIRQSQAELRFKLPRQGVSLLVLQF